MKYIDAHCHLESDILPANIALAITNSACQSDWGRVIESLHASGVYGAIGVHPWYVSDLTMDWREQMRKLLVLHPNLMVGEIGLDKYKPNMTTQIDIFKQQLEIASTLGRVAHIHCVGAWDKVLAALKTYTPPAIVLHGFDASPDVMTQLLRYNSYFSFGTSVCNPLRRRVHNALCACPQNRILSESDSQNLTDVVTVVHQMSAFLSVPLAELKKTIYNNVTELLKNG